MSTKNSVCTVALLLLGSLCVLADSGSATFTYLLATDFLCGLPPDARGPACPAVSSASNGDSIQITGSGTLNIHSKAVTGGGTFDHKDAAGNPVASGAWAARQLLGFHSYGSASQGLPAEFEGGLALIRVELSVGGTPVAEGVLQGEAGSPFRTEFHEGSEAGSLSSSDSPDAG